MTGLLFRPATAADADRVADLHADSWRRHYRGAYTDAYLDGDVTADRRAFWSTRLVGFVHVIVDRDPAWAAWSTTSTSCTTSSATASVRG